MSYDDSMEQDEDFIKITSREGTEFMEFPKENDGTILLSTIQAQFPRAIGLKYKGSSGAWRAVREANNVLDAPKSGWGDRIYCLTVSGEIIISFVWVFKLFLHTQTHTPTHTHTHIIIVSTNKFSSIDQSDLRPIFRNISRMMHTK